MAAAPLLWQIRFSHYNEKARWALDYKGIEHERRTLLPGQHVMKAKRLYGGKAFPVLVVDGEVIPDSSRIVEAAERLSPEPPLYPVDPGQRQRAVELESWFGEELGAQLRRALFFDLLPDSRRAVEVFTIGFGPATKLIYRILFPALRPVMRSAMGVDAAGAEDGRRRTVEALDRIEAELGKDDYLVGASFSVADLTAAALLSPLVRPAGFAYPLPERWPDRFEEFRESLKERAGFAWVEEMYRRHRGRSAAIGE